jgi:hypothetical protein
MWVMKSAVARNGRIGDRNWTRSASYWGSNATYPKHPNSIKHWHSVELSGLFSCLGNPNDLIGWRLKKRLKIV